MQVCGFYFTHKSTVKLDDLNIKHSKKRCIDLVPQLLLDNESISYIIRNTTHYVLLSCSAVCPSLNLHHNL